MKLKFIFNLLTSAIFCVIFLSSSLSQAQERPYFVTYSHEMEEPGNLDIELFNAVGTPRGGNTFLGSNIEFEYGATAWWTTEFYLDGQATSNDSTIFTGFRWENRFRPLLREHWINPVIYAEFEDTSADKALREVVGHDGSDDFLESNADARTDKEREMELKLILGSNYHGWNISENIIAEKNLSNEPWEFGYAIGASRPLALKASATNCTFCAEKFQAGIEMYGGLGDRYSFGLNDTSHYIGPTLNWQAPNGMTFSFSPQFGLNDFSIPRLYRFGISYEIDQFLSRVTSRHGGGQ
ncbi:MAG TPA: hypothetical protein VGF44_14315 [Terriglobales bacterium]|jgi:hypothetical protein